MGETMPSWAGWAGAWVAQGVAAGPSWAGWAGAGLRPGRVPYRETTETTEVNRDFPPIAFRGMRRLGVPDADYPEKFRVLRSRGLQPGPLVRIIGTRRGNDPAAAETETHGHPQ